MRVTQKAVNRTYLKGVNRNLLAYTKSTERMNTGRQFSKVSEDVSGTARAFRVRSQLRRDEQYLENIENIQATCDTAEDIARNINDWVKTVRERLVEANGAGKGPDEKKIIAEEVSNLANSIFQAINSQSIGTYVFGGSKNEAPYYYDEDGNLMFRGGQAVDETGVQRNQFDDTEVYMDIGFGLNFFEDGSLDTSSVVMTSNSAIDLLGYGTTVVDGVEMPNNILSLFNKIANDLNNNADYDTLSTNLKQIENMQSKLLIKITDIGNRSQFLEENKTRIEDEVMRLSERQNDLEATDIAEELIANNTFYAAYQVSLQLGEKIMPMSIFNFMN